MHYFKNIRRSFLVSPEDNYLLHKYLFYIDANGYPRTNISGKPIRLHKLILPDALVVDHKNRDKLDNTRDNLRETTKKQNTQNCDKKPSNTSGYKGVSRKGTSWIAQISFNGVSIHLGSFVSAEDAAREYNKHALKIQGEFAVLNEI